MAKFKLGRRRGNSESEQPAPAAAPESAPAENTGQRRKQKQRRTPMGLADARASNNLLVGLGVGLITTVTGLSAAGTFTAINAMNRQSEEAIAETERYQEEIARAEQEARQNAQMANQSGTGADMTYPEDPAGQPTVTPGSDSDSGKMTRAEFLATLPDQIQWMIAKKITYDEYGLPRDEYGSLMNDPTTNIYDPARWAYFFDSSNEEKEPKKEDLPTQTEIDRNDETSETGSDRSTSEMPVVAPDREEGYERGNYDPEEMPIQNPAVERTGGGDTTGGGETGEQPGMSVQNPSVEDTPGGGEAGDATGGETGEPSGMPVQNPSVEDVPGGTTGEGGGDSTGDTQEGPGEVSNPNVERPTGEHWWEDTNGEMLDGIEVNESGEPFYVVQPGDSLGEISGRYGFSVDDVAAASQIENPNVLYVGDIIKFPASGPSGSGTSTPGSGSSKPSGSGTSTPGSGSSKPSGSTGSDLDVVTGNGSGGQAPGRG